MDVTQSNTALTIIGWDIGGAHLKAALIVAGRLQSVRQLPCPLWQSTDRLRQALSQIVTDWPAAAEHVVTMTGEMVDLFPDRAAGVGAITALLRDRLGELRLYAGDAGWVPADRADAHAAAIASANWLATAAWVGTRYRDALLVDIGSTTTDIIPLATGRVGTTSRSDGARLSAGELVYTGAVRTPVCGLAPRVPMAGRWQALCAEFFATTADVYRLLEWLPDDADQQPSADGRGKSVAESAARLARMLGRDGADATLAEWRQVAAYLARCQLTAIADGLDLVLSGQSMPEDAPIIGAGVGRFLAQRLAELVDRPYREFGELCTDDTALQGAATDCAPAVAVGLLAARG